MSAPLDTKKVKNALLADPAFDAGTPEQAREMYLELVDALPTVLKDHLGKKVTLASYMGAKLAVVEHMLETGFIGKMLAAVPAEALPFARGALEEMIVDQYKLLRTQFREMIHNASGFLASYGVTERQMLANAQGGRFNAATLTAYDAGTLTIREVLETQPAAIFING